MATSATMNDLDDLLLSHVISYVGRGQFRFVAILNQRFHTIYTETFLNDTSTYLNTSTIELAKICVQEHKVEKNTFYLTETGYWNFHCLCISAARAGNLSVLKYLLTEGVTICCPKINDDKIRRTHNQICSHAAKKGRIHILRYAKENDFSWNKETCSSAAYNGHLDILIWLRKNGCPWESCTCSSAALNGHLDILKWARRNGCPWYKCTCSSAAFNGHLDVLKWARENGCPWDSNTCWSASMNGHLDVLKWAKENRCPDVGQTW